MDGKVGALRRAACVAVLSACLALGGLGTIPAHAADVGLTWVSTECEAQDSGSSNPTFFASNHRMIVTRGGRQIAIYDAHEAGQQLAWRDPGSGWRKTTGGATTNGYLPETLKNDRPASLALTRDASGREQAWLVWAGYQTSADGLGDLPVQMRRLTELDASGGPVVGRVVDVEAPGLGNLRPDLAFEGDRGVIVWVERTGSSTFALMGAWFEGDSPTILERVVLDASVGPETTATLVPTSDGMKIVARTTRLEVFSHSIGDPLSEWSRSGAGVSASLDARPSAVALESGDVLAAVEASSSDDEVAVVRFTRSGGDALWSLGPLGGYKQPSIASDGSNAWVFMVRASDGAVVSRQLSEGQGWSSKDRVEVADEGGGDLEWPNLVRGVDDGKLRMLLDARRCPDHKFRNHVAAYSRSTGVTAVVPKLSVGDVRVTEGSGGSAVARLRVTLSSASSDSVRVHYATADGSATHPADYSAASGGLTFAAGDTSRSVRVEVVSDRVDEPDADFYLKLSAPVNATIADGRGRATIVDDDRTSTSMRLRIGRTQQRIEVRGKVWPALSGRSVTTALWRKRHGTFHRIATKSPTLRAPASATGDFSIFRARFSRPKPGTCRVTAKLSATTRYEGSRARRTFDC
jgi:Calx-beta domain